MTKIHSRVGFVNCILLLQIRKTRFYQGCDEWHANYPTRHQNDSKHEDCVKFYLREKYGGPSPIENVVNDLNEKLDSKRRQEAQKHVRTACTCVKEYIPFTKYEALCELQELNGLVLGDNYLSRKACARFVQSIEEDIKGDLRSSIKNSRFVSIHSDGSTDKGIIEEEIVYVRFVQNGQPYTKLVSVESPNSVDAAGIMTASGLRAL